MTANSKRPQRTEPSSPATVLMVCSGNICRSPLAEQLLRARLSEASLRDLEVFSAGLNAVVDEPMDSIPARLSRQFGGDPSRSRGTAINSAIVDASDLIVVMTLRQRDDLSRRFPRAMSRCFTLYEAVRILELLPKGPDLSTDSVASVLGTVVRSMATNRHLASVSTSEDIVDPYMKDEPTHTFVAFTISSLVDRLNQALVARLWGDQPQARRQS